MIPEQTSGESGHGMLVTKDQYVKCLLVPGATFCK
jgi:hypothetical protein